MDFTPLSLAVFLRHDDVIDVLLSEDADIQCQATNDTREYTPLMLAANYGDARRMQRLLRHCPETQLTAQGGNRHTALGISAVGGFYDCAKVCLQAWSPAEQLKKQIGEGVTPMQVAAMHGRSDCAKLFLEAWDPQHQLMTCDISPLALTAMNDTYECAKVCLEAWNPEAQLDTRSGIEDDDKGMTPLMIGARYTCDPKIVRLFLSWNALEQVKATDAKGRTALVHAANGLYKGKGIFFARSAEHIFSLLDYDPSVQQVDQALNILAQGLANDNACSENRAKVEDCIKLMLSKGASLPTNAKALRALQPIICEMAIFASIPASVNDAIVRAVTQM